MQARSIAAADDATPSHNHGDGPARVRSTTIEREKNSFFGSSDGRPEPHKRKLPAMFDHFFNRRDLKQLFKCSLAVWIMTVFILIDPVLKAYGQALFFGW